MWEAVNLRICYSRNCEQRRYGGKNNADKRED